MGNISKAAILGGAILASSQSMAAGITLVESVDGFPNANGVRQFSNDYLAGNFEQTATPGMSVTHQGIVSRGDDVFDVILGGTGGFITLDSISSTNTSLGERPITITLFSGLNDTGGQLFPPVSYNDFSLANEDVFGMLAAGEYTIRVSGGTTTGLSRTEYSVTASSVPIPAAAWLFGSALMGMIGLRRKKA